MTKPKYVIVVGIDYSAASDRALDEAFALAGTKHGVEMHIANVRPPWSESATQFGESDPLPPWRLWASELQEYVARKVAAFRATEGALPCAHVHTHQRMNDPAHELVELAASVEANLLVVGTHDWRSESPQRLGSVAEAVTRLAPCPVLVVRRSAVHAPAPAPHPGTPHLPPG